MKEILPNVLNITNAGDILFYRAHRVGQFSGGKVRPLVVKFHYFTDREKIHKASFGFANKPLKAANLGIDGQIPRQIRVALLFYVHGKHLKSSWDGQLT